MAYIKGHARDQAALLPASVEDYVAADNLVRFIDAFVDDLDVGGAGFMRSRPKATRRPGYDRADMLKLYLYGYFKWVRSSRRLSEEASLNLDLIWLLRGMGGLQDHCRLQARQSRTLSGEVLRVRGAVPQA